MRRFKWTTKPTFLLFFFTILLGFVCFFFLRKGIEAAGGNLDSAYIDLGSELFGTVVTVLIFDMIVGRRIRLEAKMERAISQLRSNDYGNVVHAIKQLKKHGWLKNGRLEGSSLRGCNFRDADLSMAKLNHADLEDAIFINTKLEGAQLSHCNLVGADFRGANLHRAHVFQIKLFRIKTTEKGFDTNRMYSQWEVFNSDLGEIEVQGTAEAKFDGNTILPNGEKWQNNHDLDNFTASHIQGGVIPGKLKATVSHSTRFEFENGIHLVFPSKKMAREYSSEEKKQELWKVLSSSKVIE